MQEQSNLRYLLIALAAIFSAAILMPRIPALGFAMMLGIVVLIIIGVGYTAFNWWQQKQLAKAEASTFGGKVVARIQYCKNRAAFFRAEIERIDQARRELADQLERTPEPGSAVEEKGLRLLKDFAAESALRLSKAQFFEESMLQLEALLEQHKLNEQLLAKEAELESLRSENYDDVAEMESVRFQLEQDQVRFGTISELTHRADLSPDLNQTDQLRKELARL